MAGRAGPLRLESGAKVVYLQPATVRVWGTDVERINQFTFYELGKQLKQVALLEGDQAPAAVVWNFLGARALIIQLAAGTPLPLGVSRGKAQELLSHMEMIFEQHFQNKDDGVFRFPEANDGLIEAWKWRYLATLLEGFETVWREELREAATYFVPRRGIYSTPALIDAADETFPAELTPYIPQKSRDDWRSAGRCLAFNLSSAAGFHAARAVEGTVEAYYQLFRGKPGATLPSWGEYVKQLEAIQQTKPIPAPSDKVITELRQMKDDYRNPIMHPRVVLTESDARIVFNNGETLIIVMAQEMANIAKTQGGVQPSLGVV